MPIIEKKVTKLYQILAERGMSQKELYELIIKENDGNKVSMYILNEIINGKRTNYSLKWLLLFALDKLSLLMRYRAVSQCWERNQQRAQPKYFR